MAKRLLAAFLVMKTFCAFLEVRKPGVPKAGASARSATMSGAPAAQAMSHLRRLRRGCSAMVRTYSSGPVACNQKPHAGSDNHPTGRTVDVLRSSRGYSSVLAGDEVHTDLAWSYELPTRQLLPIAGLVSFYNEKGDVVIDGEKLPRPKTHFFK